MNDHSPNHDNAKGIHLGSRSHRGSAFDRYDNPWHLDKKVPITLIIALLVQTGSFIWWAAGVNFQVRDHERRIMTVETFDGALDNQLKTVSQDVAVLKERSSTTIDSLNRIEQILRARK